MELIDKNTQLEQVNFIMDQLSKKSSSLTQINPDLEVLLIKFRYLKLMMHKMEVQSIENFIQSKSKEIQELLI